MSADASDETARRDRAESVRARATAAAGTFGLGGLAGQGLAFLGGLVLARFLDPHAFGVVAFGTTILVSVQLIADGGLGVALIRQPGEVTRSQFESVMGVQVIAATIVAVAVAAVAVWFGTVGQVTAVMIATVPIIAWRSPGSVRIEREIRYRPLVIVSLTEVVVYYAWSIPGVLLGWGVWALATGAVVRALSGTLTQDWLLRAHRVWPKPRWGPVRPLLHFGGNYIAVGVAVFARDQGLNFGITWIGGLSTLGLWSFANRLLQPINLLYSTLWRITYPTMSRLQEIGEDPRPVIERIAGFVAVLTSIGFVPLVICSHGLVGFLFGARWTDVSEIFPGLCLGLLIGGPCSTALTGYLFALGDAKTPRNAILAQFAVALVATLPLLHFLGVWGLGIGAGIGAFAEAVVLVRVVRRSSYFSLRPLVVPAVCAVIAAGPLWLAVTLGRPPGVVEIAAGVAGLALYIGLMGLVDRSTLVQTVRLAHRAGFAAFRREVVSVG